MKTQSTLMTTTKHWLILLGVTLVQAIVGYGCFLAGPPLSFVGIALVILGNAQILAASVIGMINITKARIRR